MKGHTSHKRTRLPRLLFFLIFTAFDLRAQNGAVSGNPGTNGVCPIDLPAALRLAGARNLDVQIARERLKEARAGHEQARAKLFPWLAPGVAYRRTEGNVQAVEGDIRDVKKQNYAVGVAVVAGVSLGDAIYESLAAHQQATAAERALEAQQSDVLYSAAAGYFELARASAVVAVAEESVKISREYASQVRRAVDAGIAFKGDFYRVENQTRKNQMFARQAIELRQAASARLVQTLRLEPSTELAPQDAELAPMVLVEPNAALESLISRSLAARPELRQYQALAESAKNSR